MWTARLVGVALAVAAARAGEAPTGSVFWVEYSAQSTSHVLVRDVPDGDPSSTEVGKPARFSMFFLRPTPTGTMLGCDQRTIFELDRKGEVVWEISAERFARGTPGMIRSADHMSDGNVLILKGSLEWSTAIELNREGRIIRSVLAPACKAQAVRPAGEGLGWILSDRIVETDWKGKKLLSVPLETGIHVQDALKLPSGNWLVTADAYGCERMRGKMVGKVGYVAEIDPTGKILWEGLHGCPRSLQVLPNGNILVGAG